MIAAIRRVLAPDTAGDPMTEQMDSCETVLNHIRTTTTKTGLAVTACLMDGDYPLKVKVSKEAKAALNISRPDGVMPEWNYVIRPN